MKDKDKKIQEMQILEQNLQSLLLQKQAFQMELSETQSALKEIENSGEEVFKIIGQLMIKTDKSKIKQELLNKEKRQAGIIAMREIYPNFITPLGVWINREGVREAFRQKERKFDTLNEALNCIKSRFYIPVDEWIGTSVLLRNALHQEKITKYLTS